MLSRWATPAQTLLVHCGGLSVEKHAHRSIDAVAALRDSGVDARLVTVGGPLRAKLERQAAPPAGRLQPTTIPVPLRRHGARSRAEQFSWPTSAAGMLSALGAD